ncbi:dynamin family protein [Agromyces sp. NPDC056523]|uniref:dynamin family protein n=1 Tax=Agromyces sp. NPDC056523 TaxID=3345850 RepID=UPI00366EBBF6
MSARLLQQTRDLLEAAADHYAGDALALERIRGMRDRLEEPLRVAIAGMVKAGKSTLLNAIIGEEVAPTDAGECTRVIIWYRHGATPRITMQLRDGESQSLPIRRIDGRLQIELGEATPDEIERIVVEWPSSRLRDVTLIDTPGIGSLSTDISARSASFLAPETSASSADAIVYLTRHMHSADLGFLSAFHDPAVTPSRTVNAIAVLSRADEIGAGRIDALLSARGIAERYRNDGTLRSLALDVVPIAGLLAQSARTLREHEFDALLRLARLGRTARERMLVSVDRFVRTDALPDIPPEERTRLLERFGMFGLRMAAASIRAGHEDASALADELYRRSGMDELVHLVGGQFRSRADVLKSSSVLTALRALIVERPPSAAGFLAGAIERLEANAHELRELAVLAAARTSGIGLPREQSEDAERLIGGSGTDLPSRLGLDADASAEELHGAATEALRRWRALAGSPLLDRAAAEACDVVVRTCESLVVAAGPESVGRRGVRLALRAEPAMGGGQQREDPRDDREGEPAEHERLDEEAELGHGEEREGGRRRDGVHDEDRDLDPARAPAPVDQER